MSNPHISTNPSGLMDALEAMDRLNRWARVRSAVRPRKAIYWLKSRYAIRDAVMAGMIPTMRVVQSTVKCTRCTGGRYYDWEGTYRGQCYQCQGNGIVTLRFAETTIADRFIWHTPMDYRSWHGWELKDIDPVEVTLDWQPGREGEDLPLLDAVRLLNIVEDYWPAWKDERHMPYELGHEDWDSTRYYLFNYGFELPRDAGEKCALCGAEKETHLSWRMAPGLERSTPLCAVCIHLDYARELKGRLLSQPHPEILQQPDFQRWYQVHSTVFANVWKMHIKPWES